MADTKKSTPQQTVNEPAINESTVNESIITSPCYELNRTMDSDEPLVDTESQVAAHPTNVSNLEATFAPLQSSDITALDPAPVMNPELTTSSSKSHHQWCVWRQATDTTDPYAFSKTKKTVILIIIALAGSTAPIASTIYYPALVIMQNDFATTDIVMNATLSIFYFFTAIFAVVMASFGDVFGRRRIYIISFLISIVGNVCCALSVNIAMFFVFRAVSAIGSSSAMSIGAGTLADIFESRERGRAYAWFTCGPLIGPVIGPLVGGYLAQELGWRSIFWFLSIFSFCIWVAIIFFLPETWRPSTSKNVATVSPKGRWPNPLSALRLLWFPNISLAVAYMGVILFMSNVINITFSRTYTNQYHFDSGMVGLCYLSNTIGSMIGAIVGGQSSDRVYRRHIKTNDAPYPEMRIGGLVLYVCIGIQPLAITAYGWCVEKNVHWAAGLVLGFSLMLPFLVLSTYIVDSLRKKSASVSACNNFVRYIMVGIGALVSSDLQNALGSGPLFTICGGVLAVMSIIVVIIKKMTATWITLRQKEGY